VNTKRVNAAADVIHRAMENGYVTPTGWAAELEKAQMLMSPELAAELARPAGWESVALGRLREERDHHRARAAVLEAERHTTNEALSDAAEALRANRDRIAELERPALERHRREVRERYRWLADDAGRSGDLEGERVVLQQLAEREAVWAQEDVLAAEFAADPLAVKPWVPGPSVEASADRLSLLLAPVQALREDPHDSPLHHDYSTGRGLPARECAFRNPHEAHLNEPGRPSEWLCPGVERPAKTGGA
jgi:hypothetical protein